MPLPLLYFFPFGGVLSACPRRIPRHLDGDSLRPLKEEIGGLGVTGIILGLLLLLILEEVDMHVPRIFDGVNVRKAVHVPSHLGLFALPLVPTDDVVRFIGALRSGPPPSCCFGGGKLPLEGGGGVRCVIIPLPIRPGGAVTDVRRRPNRAPRGGVIKSDVQSDGSGRD